MAQALRPFVIDTNDLFFLSTQVGFPTIKVHAILSDGTTVYGYQDPSGAWHDVAFQSAGSSIVNDIGGGKITTTVEGHTSLTGLPASPVVFDPTTVVYHGPDVVRYDAPGAPTLLLQDGQLLYNGPRDFQGLRNVTGLFNNLEAGHSVWGATGSEFYRLVPADYSHYVQEVIGGSTGSQTTIQSSDQITVTSNLGAGPGYSVDLANVVTTTATTTTTDGGHISVSKVHTAYSLTEKDGVLVTTFGGAPHYSGGTIVTPSGTAPAATDSFSGGELDTTSRTLKFNAGTGKYDYVGAGNGDAGTTTHNFHTTNGVSGAADYSDPSQSVVDYTPRMISELVASSTSPTLADSAMSRAMDPADLQTFTYDFIDPVTGLVTEKSHVETTALNINSVAADPRLSGWFVLFGQFFDHGLDFIAKPGDGPTIQIALAVDDPMYGQIGPDGQPVTSITINRATPDAGTGVNGIPATYHNNTSPYIDQSQTYGSNEQIDLLLRKWVLDPNTGTYHAGAQLLDGFSLKKSYISNTFNDAGSTTTLNADAAGVQSVMSTTRTLPTLAELRAALLATGRDDLTWEDVTGNYRIRDDQGHVRTDFTGPTANTDGSMGSGEPIILDNNPSLDSAHLTGFGSPNFTYKAYTAGVSGSTTVATGQSISGILNAALGAAGSIDLAVDPLNAAKGAQLHLHLSSGPGAGDYYGLAALAPWIDFSTNSILPSTGPDVHAAVGELLMESLSSFYVAGDGRANENFGLTTVHHVFHEDHNVQLVNLEKSVFEQTTVAADLQKWMVAVSDSSNHSSNANVGFTGGHYVATGGVLALIQGGVNDGELVVVAADATGPALASAGGGTHSYILTDADGRAIGAANAFTNADGIVSWNQDTLFNATKLMVEMEYQHVAIDQYARLITPDLPEFVTYDATIQADISVEYAQAAFRFGHSQLRDSIDALDPSNVVTGNILHYALEAAFLNPQAFASVGPSDLVMGMTHQAMNETDEFVTPALQQTLLGQPLDLAAINIARGRDLGIPTLNETRKALYDALVAERAAGGTGTQIHAKLQLDQLKPYNSWSDFESSIMHKGSIVNFIAAYSFDGNLAKAQLVYDLSHGVTLTDSDNSLNAGLNWSATDAINFMSNNVGGKIAGADGYNSVDLWIGGLAESHVIGGQLGYTFNAIFEDQMERLMDGDRFYYLYRLFGALPSNLNLNDSVTLQQFKDIIERTTGTQYLNGDVMTYADSSVSMYLRPDGVLDSVNTHNVTLSGVGNDGTSHTATNVAIDGVDHKYGALAESLQMGIYSDGGSSDAANGQVLHHISAADKFLGTNGVSFQAITGDYIYDARPTDPNANSNGNPEYGAGAHETIVGTAFNDYIDSGDGDDTLYGGAGNDILLGNGGGDHVYGGDGNDLIYGGGGTNGADVADFLDGGTGNDVIYGGQNNGVTEIVMGGDGNDFLYGESGIDEVHGQRGDDYVDGGNDTDVLFGDEGNDYMFGGEGPDTIYGGVGDDIIDGGSGTDVQAGEIGDDILFGSQGGGVTQGDADELIGGDTNGNDNGFDIASFQVVDQALNVAADLNNQNLNGTTNGVPFLPFNELWMGIDGVVGTKFDDQFAAGTAPTTENPRGNPFGAGLVGDDNANWLIGGSGSDRIQGEGGNDVIVGGSIRLDALIGHYIDPNTGLAAAYDNTVDSATHRVHTGSVLSGGVIDAVNKFLGADTFAKHFTDMLQSEARKDVVLGDDATNANKGADTAVFTGSVADYSVKAIDSTGALVGTLTWTVGNGGQVTDHYVAAPNAHGAAVAYLVTDNNANRLAADGLTVVNDGKDVLVGIDNVQFANHLVTNLAAQFDIPPTLDLHYAQQTTNQPVASDNFNGFFGNAYARGTGWASNWTEANDLANGNAYSAGQIQVANNALRFASGDGASIQRAVDLSGKTSATISFNVNENNFGNGETVKVSFAADGTNFVDITTFNSATNATYNNNAYSFTVNAPTGGFSSNALLKFEVNTVANVNGSGAHTLTVDNVNVTAPVTTDQYPGNNYTTTYAEQLIPAAIASSALISDPDGTTIASATVHLRNGLAGDILTAGTLPGGITASGSGTGTIILTGIASHADYQAALAAITFSNPTNDNPTNADRFVDVTVNDGYKDSNVATTTVHFVPVDDPTTLVNDTVITNIGVNANITIADAALLANDPDPDGGATIASVAGASGGTVTHAGTTVTFRDTGLLGGSFTYHAGNQTGGDATVTVSDVTSVNLIGGTGGEILLGNSSANVLTGNGGNDYLDGGAGSDTASFTGLVSSYSFSFNSAGQLVISDSTANRDGSDTLVNIERLSFSDATYGNSLLVGTSGNNTLTAGTPPQVLIGGQGADSFVFASTAAAGNGLGARDVILDFTTSAANATTHDVLNLSGIDANTGQNGNQVFSWDGEDAIGNHARGHVGFHYETINGVQHTIIEGNTNSNAASHNFQIDLVGHLTFTPNDDVIL